MPKHTTHSLLAEDDSVTTCGYRVDGLHLVTDSDKHLPTCPQCLRLLSRKGKPATPQGTVNFTLDVHYRRLAKRALHTSLTAAELEDKWRKARSDAIDAKISLVLALHHCHDPFAVAQKMVDIAVRNGDKPVEEWT